MSLRRTRSAQWGVQVGGDGGCAAGRGAPDAERTASTYTDERTTDEATRRVLCVGGGAGMRPGATCAGDDSDPQKECDLADAEWAETWYDIVRAEAGGVAGASGVVERDDEHGGMASVE